MSQVNDGPTGQDGSAGRAPLSRVTTGNAQIDAILGGGFPASSINILMGEPGSGKTILAERLIFANAREGERPILYLSTLSEPLEKLVRYLQQFEFYDEAMLLGPIVYDALGPELAERGIDAVIPKLKEVITSIKPKILVIDSFKAIHDLAPSIPAMRRMLYEMAGLLTAYETTTFLVGEYSSEQVAVFPEFAVADGMIELARSKLGTRDERYLRVLKLRGSSYLEGLHGFRITGAGLDVFPRLVSPDVAPSYDVVNARVPVGIEGLDGMLGGGLRMGRSSFLVGATGTGKTTLALQFALEGTRRGEPSLYVNFEENPTQLSQQLHSLGVDLDEACRRGLRLLYASPVELQIDSILTEIFQLIHDANIRRLVIDGIGDLYIAASDTQRLHGYLYALLQHFAVRGVTSILTYEALQDLETRLSPLADNILVLGVELGHQPRRTVRIVKARGTDHELRSRELRITGRGVQIG